MLPKYPNYDKEYLFITLWLYSTKGTGNPLALCQKIHVFSEFIESLSKKYIPFILYGLYQCYLFYVCSIFVLTIHSS